MASSVETYDVDTDAIAADLSTTIDASSRPIAAATTRKINGVCGQINVELEALGLTPSNITLANDANLYQKIRDFVIEEVTAWWQSVNLRTETDYARDRHERWESFRSDMRARFGKALGSSAPQTSRYHATQATLRDVPANLSGSDRWFD